MNYRIETKEAFDVFGIETVSSLSGEDGFVNPAELWRQSHQNGDYERLFNASGNLPKFISQDLCKIHGVENYRKTEGDTFPYMLCSFVSDSSKTDGYKIKHILSQTYAIFPSEKFKWDEDSMEVLRNLQKRFYSEWLPTDRTPFFTGFFERAFGSNPVSYITNFPRNFDKSRFLGIFRFWDFEVLEYVNL